MTRWTGICTCILLVLTGCATVPDSPDPAEVRRAALLEQEYPVLRAVPSPVIDGTLQEAVWGEAKRIPMMLPQSLAEPVTPVDARMVWTDEALFLAYRVTDRDLAATLTDRDAETWYEDVVEAFFNTTTNDAPYYEFEFSPRGTIYDSIIGRRGAAGSAARWSAWDAEGLEVATTYEGTLNQWRDRDAGYVVEVKIPFAALETLKGRVPRAGDTWTFCLAAYNYSVYLKKGNELMASAPLTAPYFHQFEYWRTMRFE